jgi:hypothetical protein
VNEAQRYLRYVMPGVLFAVQAVVLLWISLPEWTNSEIIQPLAATHASLAIAVASVFASGAIGYVFATAHHWLHWHLRWDQKVINHSAQIKRLRDSKLLEERPTYSPVDTRLEAFDAMTVAWLPRLEENTPIGNAEKRITRFADLAHSAGAARVATGTALTVVLVIYSIVGEWNPTLENVVRFVVMLMIGIVVPLLFDQGYRHTGGMSQRVYDRILESVLKSESMAKK